MRDGGLLAGGFGRSAVMCTREGESKVEATDSASYSESDEEEVEEEEKTDLSLSGRKSLHCREKPDLFIEVCVVINFEVLKIYEIYQNSV